MINKVTLVGSLGQDPEIKTTQNGDKIATFSLATSESWKDKSTGERKSLTQWHKVVVYNENLANVVEQYAEKGTKLYVEGSLQYSKYTGNDGVEKSITQVVVSKFKGEIQILSFKEEQNTAKPAIAEDINDLDDEIPF